MCNICNEIGALFSILGASIQRRNKVFESLNTFITVLKSQFVIEGVTGVEKGVDDLIIINLKILL